MIAKRSESNVEKTLAVTFRSKILFMLRELSSSTNALGSRILYKGARTAKSVEDLVHRR